MVKFFENGVYGTTNIDDVWLMAVGINQYNANIEELRKNLVASVVTLALEKMQELGTNEISFSPVSVDNQWDIFLGEIDNAVLDEDEKDVVHFYIGEEEIDLDELDHNSIFDVAKSIKQISKKIEDCKLVKDTVDN